MPKIYVITVNGNKGFETYIVSSDSEQNALKDLKKKISWLGYDKPTIEDICEYLDTLHQNVLKMERDWC